MKFIQELHLKTTTDSKKEVNLKAYGRGQLEGRKYEEERKWKRQRKLSQRLLNGHMVAEPPAPRTPRRGAKQVAKARDGAAGGGTR